jgi:hypothetical protein
MRLTFRLLLTFFLSYHIGYSQSEPTDPIALADSLISFVLQQEGLYTLYGGLKPISTVHHFSYDIDSISGNYLNEEYVANNLQVLSNSLHILRNDSIGYTVLPFRAIHANKRHFEILIYHKKAFRELIAEKSGFFLKRGILHSDSIEKILAITEFEEKYDRYRAYGYFFGYPDHAVDFFVEAARFQDNGGDFVTRDFYQIPVANGQEGRFVYAVPKGYEAQEVDEKTKAAAGKLLDKFQMDWKNYEDIKPTIKGYKHLHFLYYLSNRYHHSVSNPIIEID